MNFVRNFIIVIVIFISSCTNELNISALPTLLDNDFRITITTYGGLAGMVVSSFRFKEKDSYIHLKIIDQSIWPNEVIIKKLDLETFEEIKESIFCIAKIHRELAPTRSGCSPLFESDYLFESTFSNIYINPIPENDCGLDILIFDLF